jgi:tetratricopeptide (TPR) repeat protein
VLLARIALAQRDAGRARAEAELASKANPGLPITAYIDARLRHERAEFEEALPLFEKAIEAVERSAEQLQDLHYFTGDTMARLDRPGEAEYHFIEELKRFPHNVRARTALATLYQHSGRIDEARQVADALPRITPSVEGFTAAARLWTQLGDSRAAARTRAMARRAGTPSLAE